MRIVGDEQSGTEVFLPQPSDIHSRAILERLVNGPTAEEVARYSRQAAARETARVAELQVHRARHRVLAEAHRPDALVMALLSAHGPHEVLDSRGASWLECNACPEAGDGLYPQSWPCPTWTLISDHTPGGEVP